MTSVTKSARLAQTVFKCCSRVLATVGECGGGRCARREVQSRSCADASTQADACSSTGTAAHVLHPRCTARNTELTGGRLAYATHHLPGSLAATPNCQSPPLSRRGALITHCHAPRPARRDGTTTATP